MDMRPATIVREVHNDEAPDDLIDLAKSRTFTEGREHALVVLPGGRRLLIKGGRDGITLEVRGGEVGIIDGGSFSPIHSLAWHVHPFVTGPSDHDLEVIRLLGQYQSVVYEINGPKGGTRFRQKGER